MSREGKGDTDWTQPVGVGAAVRHAGGEEYSVKHCGSAKCCQTQQQSGVLSDAAAVGSAVLDTQVGEEEYCQTQR